MLVCGGTNFSWNMACSSFVLWSAAFGPRRRVRRRSRCRLASLGTGPPWAGHKTHILLKHTLSIPLWAQSQHLQEKVQFSQVLGNSKTTKKLVRLVLNTMSQTNYNRKIEHVKRQAIYNCIMQSRKTVTCEHYALLYDTAYWHHTMTTTICPYIWNGSPKWWIKI